jgi:hypothetical protein
MTAEALAAPDNVAEYVRRLTAASYKLTGTWSTGPADAIIAVEVWGRQAHGDAIVHIIAGDTDIDAGTVTAGAAVDWTDEAREEFGTAWLDEQGRITVRHLALRWGTT